MSALRHPPVLFKAQRGRKKPWRIWLGYEQHPSKRWVRILLRDRCAYCHRPATTIDHIVPRACGGGDAMWNKTGACGSCNGGKGDMSLLLYLRARRQVPA